MRKGFTLVEVLIVVLIMFTVAGIFMSAKLRSDEKKEFLAACIADGVKEYICKERAEAFRDHTTYVSTPVYVR